jgi:hypothetical protein
MEVMDEAGDCRARNFERNLCARYLGERAFEKLSGHEKVFLDALKMGVDLPDSPIVLCLDWRQPF